MNGDGLGYVTMWTPLGNIVVREDDPRLADQNALHNRLQSIEQRLELVEGRLDSKEYDG